jgi:hypothetical protein
VRSPWPSDSTSSKLPMLQRSGTSMPHSNNLMPTCSPTTIIYSPHKHINKPPTRTSPSSSATSTKGSTDLMTRTQGSKQEWRTHTQGSKQECGTRTPRSMKGLRTHMQGLKQVLRQVLGTCAPHSTKGWRTRAQASTKGLRT